MGHFSFTAYGTGKTTSYRVALKVGVAGLAGQAMLAEKEQLHQQLLNEQAGAQPDHSRRMFPHALGETG